MPFLSGQDVAKLMANCTGQPNHNTVLKEERDRNAKLQFDLRDYEEENEELCKRAADAHQVARQREAAYEEVRELHTCLHLYTVPLASLPPYPLSVHFCPSLISDSKRGDHRNLPRLAR
ncbi:unnamed protein product [Dibothriocephalus latus]|uniref:Uncharacterized protein n=1 Tax=Dibothriocephalus latus TaxID=60516 RepID=A0A3P7RDB3_DIBLA|nr:unnamed protein product [Dibothriocephalus latus]